MLCRPMSSFELESVRVANDCFWPNAVILAESGKGDRYAQ